MQDIQDVDTCHGVQVRTTIDVWRSPDSAWHARVLRGGLVSISSNFDTRNQALEWAMELMF